MRPISAKTSPILERREAPYELLYGRWINEEYDRAWKEMDCPFRSAKIVLTNNGTCHLFQCIDTPEYSHIGSNGTFVITDSWMDLRGNYWYKVFQRYPMGYERWYNLYRIDRSGSVLEINRSDAAYPTALDARSLSSRIYYRQ
jgi:hypothetical protein